MQTSLYTMRHKLITIIISIYLGGSIPAFAQVAGCEVKHVPFLSGERVTYRAVYNWGFIWVNAGDVVFTVSDTIYNSQSAWHLKSEGWTLKQYDWFYKVRDRFESIVYKEGYKPVWFERDTHEGSYESYNHYQFRYPTEEIEIISRTSDRPYKQEVLPLKPCTFDILSAIYYCRSIDFSKYSIGEKIPLTMAVDNEIFELFIRYLGKEKLTTREGNSFNTIRFSVMLVEGTIFKGGEDLFVWVTDDMNKIPILVEAKILVGSVKAVLSGMEGLKYPVASRIYP